MNPDEELGTLQTLGRGSSKSVAVAEVNLVWREEDLPTDQMLLASCSRCPESAAASRSE